MTKHNFRPAAALELTTRPFSTVELEQWHRAMKPLVERVEKLAEQKEGVIYEVTETKYKPKMDF